jgi:hypothetical protein
MASGEIPQKGAGDAMADIQTAVNLSIESIRCRLFTPMLHKKGSKKGGNHNE